MKKAIVISTLIATAALNISQASAEASKEENIGFASGAVAGAAVGGPVGFIIGAATGAIFGNQVKKANELEDAKIQLAESKNQKIKLEKEFAMLQETLEFEQKSEMNAEWLSEGLTMNVMFTTDSTTLSDMDMGAIKKLAGILNEFPGLSIKLDGYADPRGSQDYNLALSRSRAEAVQQAFERFGIESKRVQIKAHGELAGMQTDANPDSYAMARKVSVNFTTDSVEKVAQN
ncbi:OmpA family protein [Aliikangiella sp. G2MR2-5]|uniref:OmpA family protein n=1 Tax=Aliikangiella sp. G2MR2-5 TaxID=2788943 RepID=UPI0018AA8815|nr:OmpA family protein [Aliikangiella sp. G2MR2-5]